MSHDRYVYTPGLSPDYNQKRSHNIHGLSHLGTPESGKAGTPNFQSSPVFKTRPHTPFDPHSDLEQLSYHSRSRGGLIVRSNKKNLIKSHHVSEGCKLKFEEASPVKNSDYADMEYQPHQPIIY